MYLILRQGTWISFDIVYKCQNAFCLRKTKNLRSVSAEAERE